MSTSEITLSEDFKKHTLRAILSIVVFVVAYLFMISLAGLLVCLCGFIGIMLIVAKPMFITIMLGAGLVSMGIMVFIFLVKFIFSKHKADRSHLVEITREEQPELFAFIGNIVQEANTKFPKRIYLSADVNAAVFYDSSFWSMILPVRKNLQIGLGLVNTVSVMEFKAIMAHEFGHFSQRSMKVGSYVYNVNRVIYNLLNENDGYNALATEWGSISSYLNLFIRLAIFIVQQIQWVLTKVYEVVNLSYMALSREMEFHADEVAAHVAGSGPVVTSLQRSELADYAYNQVLNYYSNRIKQSVKAYNIYPQQQFVMQYLARESKIPLLNNLPQVDIEHLNKYNKSKLVIKDQWASHPSTEERVNAVRRLNIQKENDNGETAMSLFRNPEQVQVAITEKLFSVVEYTGTVHHEEMQNFKESFSKEQKENAFDEIFNGYYNRKNPSLIDIDQVETLAADANLQVEKLFSNVAIDMVYTTIALESDINILKQIDRDELKVKTFDYDGVRYKAADCGRLIESLEAELKQKQDEITGHDKKILGYFLQLAARQGKADELKEKYKAFIQTDKDYDTRADLTMRMYNQTSFIQETTPYELIESNLDQLAHTEADFKADIRAMLENERLHNELDSETREALQKYIELKNPYFTRPEYNDEALQVLFAAMQYHQVALNKTYLVAKKDLLALMAQAEKDKH